MKMFKALAVAAVFVGSTSLALAQGPGIAPNSSNLPTQTGTQGTAQNPAPSAQTTHMKKSHRLYNRATTSKKKQQSKSM